MSVIVYMISGLPVVFLFYLIVPQLPLYVGLRVIDFKTFKIITIGGGSKGAVGGGGAGK